MKIGIITFQLAWNCGAVLQCAALKMKLESMGHEVCVINYRPKYKAYKYCKYQNPFVVANHAWKDNPNIELKKRMIKSIKSAGRSVLNWNPESGRLKQKRDFDKFCKQHLNLTTIYSSLEELQKNPPDCDLYISGSDQLWNPQLTNGALDGAYFLNFGSESIKKVTYAISACELSVGNCQEQLLSLTKSLDYISLRETEKQAELERLLNRKIYVTIDPTLLLQAKDYEILEAPKNEEEKPYLLVYALDNSGTNDILFDSVDRLSQEKKLLVKVISGPHKWPYDVEFYKPVDGISPSEFLKYIKNAEVIVTNSFHATTFSIIYEKEFYTIGTPGRSSRVIELLEKIGLSNKLLYNNEEGKVNIDQTNIDYSDVQVKINEYQKKSIEYLEKIMRENV